jgi:hypothetical protein
MPLIQDLLATTPFFSPSFKRFQKKAVQNGPFGEIPGVGMIVKANPILSFFDDRLKYPLLVFGRIVVSILITFLLVQFTFSQPWKNFVENNLLSIVAPEPVKEELQESGNFFTDGSKRAQIETDYLIDKSANQIYKSSWIQFLSGEFFAIIRMGIIYLLIYLIYLAFGNTIPQLEKKQLKETSKMAELSRKFILLLDKSIDKKNLKPQEIDLLNQTVKKIQEEQNLKKEELQLLDKLVQDLE